MASDNETFGEDYVNDYFINRIKYILHNYSKDKDIIRHNLELIKDDYDESISNGNERLSAQEREDRFNAFIEEAKRQLEEENVSPPNNPPYNPFNDDEFRGGKRKMRRNKKTKKSKRKTSKKSKRKTSKKSKRKTSKKSKRKTSKKSKNTKRQKHKITKY